MRRGDHRLRRWVREQLRSLGAEPPLQVEDLCRRYGQRRGRPLELVPAVLPGRVSGATLVGPDADLILYQQQTTAAHQHFVITHELAHLMLGHQPDPLDDDATIAFWRSLMPTVPEDFLRRALFRSCSDAQHERDAETTARTIRDWAAVLDHLYPAGFDVETPRWVRGAFSERQGWL